MTKYSRIGGAFLLGTALASAAQAAPPAPAREAARHFEAALEHVDAGAYSEAIAEFLRAYELHPHYSVLYNLALAYAETGQSTLAIATFERYLAEGSAQLSVARKAAVKDLILEQKKRLAELEIRIAPESAHLFVNGKEIVPAPDGTVSLDPATYDLEVRALGHETFVTRVELASGEQKSVAVSLAPQTTPARPLPDARLLVTVSEPRCTPTLDGKLFSGQPLVPGRHVLEVACHGFFPWSNAITLEAGRTSSVNVVLEPTTEYLRENDRAAHLQRSWAYVAGAGALALGLDAVLLRIYNDRRYDRWQATSNSLPPIGAPSTPAQDSARRSNDDLKASIKTVDHLTVAFAVSSAALLGGAAWLYFSAPPDRYAHTRSASWRWTLTGSGVVVQSEF